jgi:hypothetical protein
VNSSVLSRTRLAASAAAGLGLLVAVIGHRVDVATIVALAAVIVAAFYDAAEGSLPTVILIVALMAAGVHDALVRFIAFGALLIAPIAIIAWRSHETAIGWGDVLTLLAIFVLFPLPIALAAAIAGTALSYAVTLASRERSGRMIPFLAVGAVMAVFIR